MDFIRTELNQLMGKDRNKPLFIRIAKRDHFDDPDICKYNLLGFCPNDLFPNTKADIGPCEKRHDDYLKEQYQRDPDLARYEKRYQDELIAQLEHMISLVDLKIKRSLARAEAGPLGRLPDQPDSLKEMNLVQQETVHDKIELLEQKISLFNDQAEQLGEAGKIDEVATLLEEIEKFKKQKNDLEALVDNNVISQDKNMKVCEICGALQSALDTGKRLTMHLEGKLHTGYLKIRNMLAELKMRRNRGDSPRRDSRVQRPRVVAPEKTEDQDLYDGRMIFSSRKHGSGQNVPSGVTNISFTQLAIQKNQGYHHDSQQLGVTNLGKEWRWYKKELEAIRRKAKKDAERKAQQGERSGYHERGNTDRPHGQTNYSRDRPQFQSRDDRRGDYRR